MQTKCLNARRALALAVLFCYVSVNTCSIILSRSSSSDLFTISCYLQVKRVVAALSLKKKHIFSSLKREALKHIAKKCVVYKITEGALLMKQGDAADCLYVVISGGFRVSRDFLQTPPEFVNATELAFIEEGDVVGDIGAKESM